MVEVFVSRVRPIGSSFGVIIPKELLEKEGISVGEEISLSILKRKLKAIDELFGSMKGVKAPFVRDRRDRI